MAQEHVEVPGLADGGRSQISRGCPETLLSTEP